MNIIANNITFDRNDPKSIAQALYDYLLWLHGQHVRNAVIGKSDIVGALSANRAYDMERKKYNDAVGWRMPPYSDAVIINMRTESDRLDEIVIDSDSLLKFYFNKFV